MAALKQRASSGRAALPESDSADASVSLRPPQMRYVQPFPGQYASMDPAAVIDVCAFIGTPSLWKELAALAWRVGPTYLFEEVLSPEAVGLLYAQGTAYMGNYLDLRSTGVCVCVCVCALSLDM